jgi:hypothetical protein
MVVSAVWLASFLLEDCRDVADPAILWWIQLKRSSNETAKNALLVKLSGWLSQGCPLAPTPLHQRQQLPLKLQRFRDHDGAPVRLLHAGLVQDLSAEPEGAG